MGHFNACLDDGTVYLWGFGQHGALSQYTQLKNVYEPIPLPKPEFLSKGDGPLSDPLEKLMKRKKKKMNRFNELENDDKIFPFLVEGQKVSLGHVFQHHYENKIIDVQCGMDSTLLSMITKPKDGFLEKLTLEEIQDDDEQPL